MMEATFGLICVVFIFMMVVFVKLMQVQHLVEQLNLKVNDAKEKLVDVEYGHSENYKALCRIEHIMDEIADYDDCEDCEEPDEEIHLINRETFKYDWRNDHAHVELVYDEEAGLVYDAREYASARYAKKMGLAETFDAKPLNNIPELIGDGLVAFDYPWVNDDVIYIRNHRLKTDFEVGKSKKKEENSEN